MSAKHAYSNTLVSTNFAANFISDHQNWNIQIISSLTYVIRHLVYLIDFVHEFVPHLQVVLIIIK